MPTGYLLSARVFLPKALVARNWLIRNLRRIQFAMQEEQLYAKCGQDERTSTYQSYCVSALLFSKKISTKQDITSTEISYQFLVPKVPVLRRNKATNSSSSTDPISAAKKTLGLGNLFKLERFAITFTWPVCHRG